MDRTNFFIVSGGPGAGKTSIIERLSARGFTTVAEAGRTILREQAEIEGTALQGGRPAAFGELMLARGIDDYRRMARGDDPVFFDRGIAELAGYWRLIGLPVPEHVRAAARYYRSNAAVFLAPPWREIYRQDAERPQDWAEAVRTFDLMRESYIEGGYTPVEIPPDTVARRVDFILARVSAA